MLRKLVTCLLAVAAIALVSIAGAFGANKRLEYIGSFEGPGATGSARIVVPANPKRGDHAKFGFKNVEFFCDGAVVAMDLGPGTARFVNSRRFHLDSLFTEGGGLSLTVFDGRITRGGKAAKGSIMGMSRSNTGSECGVVGGRAQWSAKLR